MSRILNVSRRDFLKTGAAAGGGLVLGFALPLGGRFRNTALAAGPAALNAFLRIDTDGLVTILVNKSEMGQGVYTSLPMLVAEELAADWSKIRVEAAPVGREYAHPTYGMQFTGGSQSVASEWERLRKVGAAGREMLLAAAAESWKVPGAECRAENGSIVHSSGRKLGYGALAETAARMPVPKDPPLKDPKDFRIIGKPTPRLDGAAKVAGSAVFGLDVNLPGMLVAVVARPPVFGGAVKAFRAEKARAVPGVKDVVRIPSGIAVIAESFWAARQGRDALEVDWEEGEGTKLSTPELRRQYAELAGRAGTPTRKEGDAETALAAASRRLTADYEVPFLAHAPMEPLNCVVDLRPDSCELWVGTQMQTGDQAAAAQAAGLKPEQVRIHTTFLGGGFGRRANPRADFVTEAVHAAKAAKAPLKLVWTREDDTKGGFYRPFWYDRLSAALDGDGKPVAWTHRIVGQSIIAGTPFEAGLVKEGIDATSVEGASDLPYAIPNVLVELHSPKLPVPVLWWRSVGHSHTGFVVESFVDELAHAAGRDPLEFRRALLAKQPRHLGVLELAAARAGWSEPPPAGRARGIAVHASFGSWVAEVAEVSVADGRLRVHKVVCAVDCGRAINPKTIEAQMESAIVFGLSAALHGAITFAGGRVQQSNFDDYPVVRMDEMPAIEVHIVPSAEAPSGIGEPGLPPIAAAVANAVFAASGKRVRHLPIRPEDLKD